MSDTIERIPAGEHRMIAVHRSLLEKNNVVAARNRQTFLHHRVFVVNLVSSPGAGKTALVQRLLDELGQRRRIGVIVADLATDNDAKRLCGRQAPVLQITTGTLCHLEADMIGRSLEQFSLDQLDLLIIENVGNLVCPAGYDLGESLRVVVASVTEGADKPIKYPTMYQTADVVLLNKIDLADATGFQRELAFATLHEAAPRANVFEVSARTEKGLAGWHEYLDQAIRTFRAN